MTWSEEQIAAIKALLMNWANLSDGDISVLHSALGTPDSQIATVEGCANFILWDNLVRIGWAKRLPPPPVPVPPGMRPAFFVLTAEGRARVPAFLAQFKLKSGSWYNPPPAPPRDPAWFDRALESAGASYVETRDYRGFTAKAAAELRRVEMGGVAIALWTFAADAKDSVAGMLSLAARDERDGVAKAWMGLGTRILGNWAFKKTGLPLPHPSLHELGGRLGIGLGIELQTWLHGPSFRLPVAGAWLGRHGPEIDQFCNHLARRQNNAAA